MQILKLKKCHVLIINILTFSEKLLIFGGNIPKQTQTDRKSYVSSKFLLTPAENLRDVMYLFLLYSDRVLCYCGTCPVVVPAPQ